MIRRLTTFTVRRVTIASELQKFLEINDGDSVLLSGYEDKKLGKVIMIKKIEEKDLEKISIKEEE